MKIVDVITYNRNIAGLSNNNNNVLYEKSTLAQPCNLYKHTLTCT